MNPFVVEFSKQATLNSPDTMMAFMIVEIKNDQNEIPALRSKKQELVRELQNKYPNKESILKSAVIQAYQKYYQQFNANYHVRFQIESVALKGKPLPERSLLVDAMFMAEIKHGVLIAGHDLHTVTFPLTVDSTHEGEQYPLLSGEIKTVKANDLCIRDRDKILSTILYGPELSSPITRQTNQALYTIYGPSGVTDAVLSAALDDIQATLRLVDPSVQTLWREIFQTD
jgi:DNA/RNA-binding domain of Phe-tRNA-synthetase-like protein